MGQNKAFLSGMLLTFTFVLSIIGCAEKDQTSSVQIAVTDSFKTFQVDPQSELVALSELITEVEIMSLEETDSSLLSYVSNISSFEDKLVFPSGSNGEIFVFSTTGEFIRKFGHKGEGPGEYSDLKSMWMMADTILVFNHDKQSLLYYDLYGEHLKTIKFEERPNHVATIGNDILMEMSFEPIDDSLQYRLMIQNSGKDNKRMLIPYHKALPFPVYSNISAFKTYRNQMVFQPAFHDTVYLVDADESRPFFSIDFDGGFFWSDEELYEKPEGAMGQIAERNQVWVFNTFVGNDQMVISFNTSFRDFFMGVIDRETGKYSRFDLRRTPEERFLLIMLKAEGDRFLFNLPSVEVAEFIEEIGEQKVRFREGSSLQKIESSENPAMLWVKFK